MRVSVYAAADDVAALRLQVSTLNHMLRNLDLQGAAAAAQRDSAVAESARARADATAANAARDDAGRKLSVLKARLVTQQSEAEEASTWHIQEALRQEREKHATEARSLQEQVQLLP